MCKPWKLSGAKPEDTLKPSELRRVQDDVSDEVAHFEVELLSRDVEVP